MDIHPLSQSTIAFLREPVTAGERWEAGGIRQALDEAFIGSEESRALDRVTSRVLGPGQIEHFFSELPSLAIEILVVDLGVSPIHASPAQLHAVLYERMPAKRWFDGYEREDLLSFVARWIWLARVFGGPSLAACRDVCMAAVADFDAGDARLPRYQG